VYEHPYSLDEIATLREKVANGCRVGGDMAPYIYQDIAVSQVVDISGIVVFIGVNTGGYIPVSPSTVNPSIQAIGVKDIVLLKPEDQYLSLMKLVEKHKDLLPVSVTVVNGTSIITGIKLKNGYVAPVSHMEWSANPLPVDDELFYIEKYYRSEDVFPDEEKNFKNNLKRFTDLVTDMGLTDELKGYIEKEDYEKIIKLIGKLELNVDEASRLAWYYVNNN
jgi:hypothetical protein